MIDPSSASFEHFYFFTISIKDSKVKCMSYLGKERAGTEKETKGGKHHGNRGPQSSPVDLAEEGKRKDETDLADLVS